jgi:fimbrial chaperone protein
MRFAVFCFALAAVFAVSSPAVASDFTVSPTAVDLSSSKTSALVVLKNVGKAKLRFEITAFVWGEAENGEMMLTPTSDVTFFPKLVELAPGVSRNIRISVGGGPVGNTERSFRLFVEELPDQGASKPSAIAIRTKIGLPVFVRPLKPARSATIESVMVENGKVLTRVHNTGNLHVVVDGLTLHGLSSSGAQTFSSHVDGWYVLAGATRIFAVPLSASNCTGTSTIAVEVSGHGKTLKGSSAVSGSACVAR